MNSSLVGSRSLTACIRASGSPLHIAGNRVWGDYFKGRIDEVRVYNRAPTSSQLQTAMNPLCRPRRVTLACNTPLAMQLEEALRGNARAGIEKTVGWSMVDSATNRNLRLRDASASSEAQPHLVDVGELQLTPQWQRIEISETFVNPVVIACAVSTAGSAAALIDVRHVEPSGFEIRLQQMIAGAGTPLSGVAGFLVLERGTYTLSDGTLVEAASAVATLSGASYGRPSAVPLTASSWC